MSKKKTVIVWKPKRKRKIPETIQHRLDKITRRRKEWKYRKRQEAQHQELDEISGEYEHLSHEELTQIIAWLYLRYREISAQAREFAQQLRDAEFEMYRILRSDPTALTLDQDIGTHDLAGRLHKLAGISVANGRIMQSTLSAKKSAMKMHSKHTEPKKSEVHDWWHRWQAKPNMFKNKTTFDEIMSDKTGMKTRTIEQWRLDLQKKHTAS